jgi:hypothetical protein
MDETFVVFILLLTFNGQSAQISAAMSMVKMDEVHRFVHVGI